MASKIFYNRQPGNPSGCPGGLKVKSAGDTVEVEAFSGKVQPGGELAFHCSKVHFFQAYSTTGHELYLVGGLSLHARPIGG